jgi:predicted site-specific integrase-resolvase
MLDGLTHAPGLGALAQVGRAGVERVKVVGYTRVSTREQAEDGHGLAAQRRAIATAAEARGWDVEWIEDAGYTARSDKRPGLTTALHMLRRREAQVLVVSKLDRLSRSVQHLGLLHGSVTGWVRRPERPVWA